MRNDRLKSFQSLRGKAGHLTVQVAQYEKIIRELNEALVIMCRLVEYRKRGAIVFAANALGQIAFPTGLEKASTALSHVPEHLRQGGTWRLEE